MSLLDLPRYILKEKTDDCRGSILQSKRGNTLFECTHFDSTDTILVNILTNEQKILNTYTLHRYYDLLSSDDLLRYTCEGCGKIVDSEASLNYVLGKCDEEYQLCDECA